jgi:hypothetical protein
MSTQDNVDSLEEEALKRKERLKSLKRKHDEASKDGAKSEGGSIDGMASLPRLVVSSADVVPCLLVEVY